MDLLYSGNVDGFAIVSSDSDFTRLATRLRESGKTVYGLGRRRTPASLVAACDRFIYLEVLGTPTPPPRRRTSRTSRTTARCRPRCPTCARCWSRRSTPPRTTTAGRRCRPVGSHISRNHPSFDPRNYGYSKLVELARAQDFVDVEQTGDAAIRVRLTPSRPAKKSTPGKTGPVRKSTRKTAARKGSQS